MILHLKVNVKNKIFGQLSSSPVYIVSRFLYYYKVQLLTAHLFPHASSMMSVNIANSCRTSNWTASLQKYLHNHHTLMANSLCSQWGDHHVSGDLLLQWISEHNHTPGHNHWTGTKDHLHLLCCWLHHHRTRDTTASTDHHCSYT